MVSRCPSNIPLIKHPGAKLLKQDVKSWVLISKVKSWGSESFQWEKLEQEKETTKKIKNEKSHVQRTREFSKFEFRAIFFNVAGFLSCSCSWRRRSCWPDASGILSSAPPPPPARSPRPPSCPPLKNVPATFLGWVNKTSSDFPSTMIHWVLTIHAKVDS